MREHGGSVGHHRHRGGQPRRFRGRVHLHDVGGDGRRLQHRRGVRPGPHVRRHPPPPGVLHGTDQEDERVQRSGGKHRPDGWQRQGCIERQAVLGRRPHRERSGRGGLGHWPRFRPLSLLGRAAGMDAERADGHHPKEGRAVRAVRRRPRRAERTRNSRGGDDRRKGRAAGPAGERGAGGRRGEGRQDRVHRLLGRRFWAVHSRRQEHSSQHRG
mmetsp:Transcript_14700/g.28126  ORF Transcript_14700/g.28126 Transcript_14700/m.28126 type:complete len:214 (+) Transcript_14700:600-1241(+)